jgi:hypothetical protein
MIYILNLIVGLVFLAAFIMAVDEGNPINAIVSLIGIGLSIFLRW